MIFLENRLKILREALGKSQTALADDLHMSPSTISLIESGNRNLTERMVHALANQYGVSEEWLLTGEGEMFPSLAEDAELIDTYALLGAQHLSPQHKRLAIVLMRTIADLPDDALPALRELLHAAAAALDDPPPGEEKKDEV